MNDVVQNQPKPEIDIERTKTALSTYIWGLQARGGEPDKIGLSLSAYSDFSLSDKPFGLLLLNVCLNDKTFENTYTEIFIEIVKIHLRNSYNEIHDGHNPSFLDYIVQYVKNLDPIICKAIGFVYMRFLMAYKPEYKENDPLSLKVNHQPHNISSLCIMLS